MRKQRGFTLFETLIVLAIGVAVVGGIMFVMQSQERSERRDSATRAQAQEMSTLAKAARQWAETTGKDWAEGSRNVVSIDDLVDNGLLPEGFGDRSTAGQLGFTPTGQRYTVVSIKNGPSGSLYHDPNVPVGKVRTVIWDAGDPNAGRLERIGVPNVVGAILAWKEAVSLWGSREYSVPMGVIPVGSGEVRGVGRSFTKDVIDWIENAVTQPAAVALVGFPDLEPDRGGGGGPGGVTDTCEEIQFIEERTGCPGATTSMQCEANYVEPSCPAGWEELMAGHICRINRYPPMINTTSGLGAIVMGMEKEDRYQPPSMVTVPRPPCSQAGCTMTPIPCGHSTMNRSTGYVTLNGAKMAEIECSYSFYTTTIVYGVGGSNAPIASCGPASSTSRYYPTYGMPDGSAKSKVCCRRPAR